MWRVDTDTGLETVYTLHWEHRSPPADWASDYLSCNTVPRWPTSDCIIFCLAKEKCGFLEFDEELGISRFCSSTKTFKHLSFSSVIVTVLVAVIRFLQIYNPSDQDKGNYITQIWSEESVVMSYQARRGQAWWPNKTRCSSWQWWAESWRGRCDAAIIVC